MPDSKFDTYFFDPNDDVLDLLVDWTPRAAEWFGRHGSSLVTLEEALLSLPMPFGVSPEVSAWVRENPFAEIAAMLPWTNAVTKREIRIALCRCAWGFNALEAKDQEAVFVELCRASPPNPESWLKDRVEAISAQR